jgi:putative nucleotidyltransferase with HDIG domain
MLKKIPTHQLRVGMYVQAFEGRWTDHPFWRSKFLLRDAEALREVRESGVQEVWIDISRGLAPEVDAPPAPASPTRVPAAVAAQGGAAASDGGDVAVAVRTPAVPARPEPTPPAREEVMSSRVALDEEVQRAAGLCQRSRVAVISMFNEARLGKAVDARQCLPLVEDISQSVTRNPGAIVSLARLKTHDDYTYMHSVAVCALMVALARQMGLSEDEQRTAGLAGLLHDIGKAVMPQDVLNKPDKLTDVEFRMMREHPVKGHEMLREVGTAGEVAMDVVLHHHERMDGKGYPHGLTGDRISLMARMGAVTDIYDAVTSNRPYKAPWDPSEALARMAGWSPAHLDPAVFQNFVKALGIYPIGSLVRLQSGRLAVVIEQNPQALMSPVVKVFFSTRTNLPLPTSVLDLSNPSSNDRIASRESNKNWNFRHLDEMWAGRDALKRVGH